VNEKERRLAAFCRERGVDGAWLKRRTNIAWITDGADVHVDSSSSTGVGSVVWTPKKKIVICDNIEERRLREEEFGREWSFETSKWWESTKTPGENTSPTSRRTRWRTSARRSRRSSRAGSVRSGASRPARLSAR
jgi:hypothetical protein